MLTNNKLAKTERINQNTVRKITKRRSRSKRKRRKMKWSPGVSVGEKGPVFSCSRQVVMTQDVIGENLRSLLIAIPVRLQIDMSVKGLDAGRRGNTAFLIKTVPK